MEELWAEMWSQELVSADLSSVGAQGGAGEGKQGAAFILLLCLSWWMQFLCYNQRETGLSQGSATLRPLAQCLGLLDTEL